MITLPDSIPRNSQSRKETAPTEGSRTPGLSPNTIADSFVDLNAAATPRILGDYDVETMIAPGGMGIVYRARQRSTGKSVAIKTLRRDMLATPDMVARFRREVQAGEVDHPNVMPVLDAGESDGRPYLVMPLARDNLAKQMARFRDPKSAARLMIQVARGVDAAHRAGVVHRDLKPGNILLDDDSTPRVADFGLAKILDELDTVSLTCTGAVLGTPPYMAPEQAFGSKSDIGPGVDVWALGIVLYELVTGQRPFDGPSREATLERVRRIDPPPPRQWKPDLDRNLETIILTCLEKDPKHRYATAGALADDLDAWINGQSIQARRRRFAAWWRPLAASWRTWAPAMIGVAALLVIIMGLATLINPGQLQLSLVAKTEALDELQREVAAGRPVQLIGPGQPPRWHEWEFLKNGSGRLRLVNGLTVVESPNVDTLTLFKPAPPRFRLDAEVRPVQITPTLEAGFGLTFGYRRERIDNAVFDGLFTFGQLGMSRRGEPPTLCVRYSVHMLNANPRWQFMLRDHAASPAPLDRPTSFSVTVSGWGIVATRGAEEPLSIDRAEAQNGLDFAVQKMNMPSAFGKLNVAGPVGLLVSHSAIEVHSLTLTPLTQEQ